jgi:hypothetical protein
MSTLTKEIREAIQAAAQMDGLNAGVAAGRNYNETTDEHGLWSDCNATFAREAEIAAFVATAPERDLNRAKAIYANWYTIQWDSAVQSPLVAESSN